jgi:hypothetical protein
VANEVKILVTGQNTAKGPVADARRDVQQLKKDVDAIPDKKTIKVAVDDAGAKDAVGKLATAVEIAARRAVKARDDEQAAIGRVQVAELRLKEVKDKGTASTSQLAAATNTLTNARNALSRAQGETLRTTESLITAQVRLANAQAGMGDSAAPSGRAFDVSVLTRGVTSEMKSAGITAGAAFAGGLGSGMSSAGAAGFFIALAAMAQSSNQQMAESYSQLWNQVKNQVRDASDVLADDFIAGAEQLGRTMNTLKPQLAAGFAAAQPAVEDLVDGTDRLARQALPGVVTGAKAAHLATGGLADGMDHAGRGVAKFFTESAQGAAAGGDAFRAFGQIVERLGEFAGRILADLANSSVQMWPAVTGAVDATAGAVENLADHALPGLASGAAMSLNALTLLLNLVNLLIGALGPAAPAVLTFLTALKLLDMVSFGGVHGRWDSFKRSIGDAPGVAGKAKAGFVGLASTLGPVGVLAGVAAIGLDAFSRSQQRAAEREHTLSAALRESKGAIDDNVKAKLASMAADDGYLAAADKLGISAKTFTDALAGNKQALDLVNGAMENAKQQLNELSGEEIRGGGGGGRAKAINKIRFALENNQSALAGAAENERLYADATNNSTAANSALKQSIDMLQETLAGLADKNLAYRNAVNATADAQRAADDALKEHGKKSEEYGDALRGVEGAMIRQATAARDMAVASSTATTEAGKAGEGQRAYAAEVIKMAAAAGEAAPPALRQMISGLSATELAAAGATSTISKTGETVYHLPGGKTITIAADDQASARARAIEAQIAALKNKTVEITVNERHNLFINRYIRESAPGSMPLSQGRLAAGGPVRGGGVGSAQSGGARHGLTEVNEMGLELGRTQRGDLRELETGMTVVPAGQSAQIMAAANGGRGGGGGGGPVQLVLRSSGRRVDDLLMEIFRDAIAAEGGDVQTVLGS